MVKQSWRETDCSCDVEVAIPRRMRHPVLRRWRGSDEKAILRSARKPRTRLGLLIGFACVLLIALTVLVLSWFQPLPKPQLVLISSNLSNSPLMPPSLFVSKDVEALYGLNSTLNVSDADPDSLSYNEMQAVVSKLPRSPMLPAWFPWQKRTTLVYANAAGIGVQLAEGQEAVAYLLPDDFGLTLSTVGFPIDQAIAVTELLDNLAKHDADNKVLVLDCQRFDHFWPLGVLSNRFVDSVRRELRKHPERYKGIIVIFSCSPDEITWAENGYYHSAFAYFFIRGLSGAADTTMGNKDGRVSAQELFDYVRSNVQQWMATNRSDVQVPMMEAVGVDPSQVELLALDANQKMYTGPDLLSNEGNPLFEQNVQELKSAWEQYYQLARREPHPAIFRPHFWRSLEDSLLRTEDFFRGADMKSMSEELRKVSYRLQSVEDSGKPLAHGAVAYSQPMADLFDDPSSNIESPSSPKVKPADTQTTSDRADSKGPEPVSTAPAVKDSQPKTAGKETASQEETTGPKPPPEQASSQPEVTKSEPTHSSKAAPMTRAMVWKLTDDVITGRLAVDEAARKFQQVPYSAHALPVEAEMLRMLAEYGPLSQKGQLQDEVLSTALHLVRQRSLAERAAAPASYLAPRVFPWICISVNRGDQLRRVQEDAFFARDARGVSIDSAVVEAGNQASEQYEAALQSANRLSQAFRLRDLTLADSVHLVTLCSMRKCRIDVNGFRKKIDPLTLTLLSNLDQLDRLLRLGTIAETTHTQTDRISEISALTAWIEKSRGKILQLVGQEMRDLSRGQAGQINRSDDVWRRIDAILTLPFAYSDEPSETLAQRRIELLKRLCQHNAPTPDRLTQVNSKDDTAEKRQEIELADHVKYSRKLAAAFYSLPESIELDALEGERDASAFSPAISRAWLKTYEFATIASFPEHDLNRLLQANTACRIMEPYPISIGMSSTNDLATRTLQRRNFAALCAWQGLRLAEDFWAGEANAEDFYFHRTGQHYLNLAQVVDAQDGIQNVALDNRLSELLGIATQIQQQGADRIIHSGASRLVFRGVDKEELDLAVRMPDNTPPGIAALECSTPESNVSVNPLPLRKSEFPLPYLVERAPSQKVSTRLSAKLYYRGHECSRTVNVRGPADDEGPTVVVLNQRDNDAELTIRPAEINAVPANVLFILDCSRSMLFGERMETLQSTLQKFTQSVAPGTLNVGVRVFGDSVVWQEGNTVAEAAARKDSRMVLPIRPFNPKRFREIVGDLHAVGESPIMHSLLESQEDFKGLGDGEKIIVLISDGSDNWATVGEKPGLEQFETAYAANDITVHTVGFQADVEGFNQLQQIAASTGGKSVRADNGSDLLDNILGLAGVLTYTVTSQPDTAAPQSVYTGILAYDPEPLRLLPGMYDITVMGHADQIVASRSNVHLRRGDRYELLYGGGELGYLPTSDLGDVARAVDQQSGVQLQILRAETRKGDLVLEYSLSDPQRFGWFPNDVSLRVQGRGADTAYVVRDLSPNVSKHHNAVWQIRLADWPADEYLADVTVTWSDVGDPKQTVYPVQWDASVTVGTLPDGVALTRRDFSTEKIDGALCNVASVSLVFPEGYQKVQQWSIQFEQQVLRSQQTYDVLDAIYNARFVLPNDAQPQRILLRGPHGQQKSLKTVVDLRAQRIN